MRLPTLPQWVPLSLRSFRCVSLERSVSALAVAPLLRRRPRVQFFSRPTWFEAPLFRFEVGGWVRDRGFLPRAGVGGWVPKRGFRRLTHHYTHRTNQNPPTQHHMPRGGIPHPQQIYQADTDLLRSCDCMSSSGWMRQCWPLSQFHSRRLALLYPGARGYTTACSCTPGNDSAPPACAWHSHTCGWPGSPTKVDLASAHPARSRDPRATTPHPHEPRCWARTAPR